MIDQTEIEIHWCSITHRFAWERTVVRKVKEGAPRATAIIYLFCSAETRRGIPSVMVFCRILCRR
jgi:hypothetical protein